LSTRKEVADFMYSNFPKCPICKSDADYNVSGLLKDYIQCKRCKTKWLIGKRTMKEMLVWELPEPYVMKKFPQLRQMHSIDFWKEVDMEKFEKQMEMKETSEARARARARVLDHIRSNIGFEFPITESDFSPQHRKKITDLVSILRKYDATLGDARARIRADYEAKVEELAVSIKEYVLSAAHTQIDFGRLLRVLKKKGMTLKTIDCPNCSGILKISEVPKEEEVLECRYCGKSILAINLFEKFKEKLGL